MKVLTEYEGGLWLNWDELCKIKDPITQIALYLHSYDAGKYDIYGSEGVSVNPEYAENFIFAFTQCFAAERAARPKIPIAVMIYLSRAYHLFKETVERMGDDQVQCLENLAKFDWTWFDEVFGIETVCLTNNHDVHEIPDSLRNQLIGKKAIPGDIKVCYEDTEYIYTTMDPGFKEGDVLSAEENGIDLDLVYLIPAECIGPNFETSPQTKGQTFGGGYSICRGVWYR